MFCQPQQRGTVRPRSRHVSIASDGPEFRVPGSSSQAYTSTFEPTRTPASVDLVGLGFGTISFSSSSRTFRNYYTPPTDVPADVQGAKEELEKDVADVSISIYSTESFDRFSPHVPVYHEEEATFENPMPPFIVGSPELLSPKLPGANADGSYSSLPYLKQDTPKQESMANPFSDANRIELALNDAVPQQAPGGRLKSTGLKGNKRARDPNVLVGDNKENAVCWV